ncbi:MAG: biotin synthase BioB [Chitinivibrionales bacterium]|nr:biotin synthase BioB [Chitinivibrionales bacterium]MBD3356502.1 biotin synthase BioB [Chitinivibrionales bacterium]
MSGLFCMAEELYDRAVKRSTTEADLETVIDWPEDRLSVLFACTDQVRHHFFDDSVEPCAIMNIKSGGCSEDCAFCSQSSHNDAKINVKALANPEEIIKASCAANDRGLAFGVVSSGRKLTTAEIQRLAGILHECEGPIHASLGILTQEEFALLRDAGVVCYNHNLETGRDFFGRIVTTHGYDDRVATVRRAKRAGMKVCCGGIFGIGESWSDRKALCMELRGLDVDSVPINFLNPIAGTRVATPEGSTLQYLKIIALFRMALPDKHIKVCGGREVNLGIAQPLMFLAGADGYISGDYLTTQGQSVDADEDMIAALGLRKRNP